MRGIILAGGTASRLLPLTKNCNKHLLPIYNKQMICYPIKSLVNANITEIMIVSGKEHSGQFIELLGDGSEYGAKIVYGCQMRAGGIAEALMVAKEFVGDKSVCVILGDNIFQESILSHKLDFISSDSLGESHAHVVCAIVDEPQHYGVLSETDEGIEIVEKPKEPKTRLAVTGLYFYSSDVFDMAKLLKYSARGELEVTDLNNAYAKKHKLTYSITNGIWIDCGVSVDHLLECGNTVKEMKRCALTT
jgi:glucose-1-phosphate thymidylyltransferase